MKFKRVVPKWFAAIAVTCLLAAPAAQAQKLEEVNYLLPAPPVLPAFIPWVLAQQRGYYAREGLDVKFQVGKGGVDVAVQVGAGNAVVGGGIGDTPIIARAQGIPIKAVAVLGGGSLTNLVVHDGQGVNGPADLKGKTVTVLAFQDTTFYSLLGMMASAGLVKNDVNVQAAGPVGIWQLFAAGKAQAFAGPVDWAVDAKNAGAKIRIYRGDRYFPSMAQAIIASDATIQKRPDLIRKLVRGTVQGLADIIKEGKGVIPDYIRGAPGFKGREAFLEEVIALYTEYTYGGQKVLGAMDAERLATVQKFYVSQGIVAKEAPINDLFTNQFLQ
ncbi:MAG: ABC transporter substrate-binding protein [Betaproteobacteria bacterium]|nr:ABC transporter substrate-binding protein [Betaproteobacteria bacterium]